jgi:hypothetical protein
MSKKSDTLYFKIPEPLNFGWSFKMTVEHIIDRMPQFASVSGARKGGKLIDAVEKAERDPAAIVAWPTELCELVQSYVNSEQFQMPSNQIFRNGIPTDQIVPKRMYLPHIDAILEAAEVVPSPTKSMAPDESTPTPEAPKADEAPAN